MVLEPSNVLFIVSARSAENVPEKITELRALGYPFIVVCAEKVDLPGTVYRARRGKYDAINYAAKYLRDETKIVCLNDVDTKIVNFPKALEMIRARNVALVYCRLKVRRGPQVYFYSMMDRIRDKFQIVSSGELMLLRRSAFDQILPIPPCKTEDNYISFKILELGYDVTFCEDAWVETERTVRLEDEKRYKTRTVTGIYQALSQTKTKPLIRVFYLLLPFVSPLLLLQGQRGVTWMKGIINGLTAFLRGDRTGKF
jgi:cellulose synthase/poly-beta-1,6-N-acetylglucosamine synthase-like glycosyltransferase